MRKGVYAGDIFLQNKYKECIVAEDAIPVRIKNKYANQIDISWFIREYRLSFLRASIGKYSSGTFSHELLKKMIFKVPSKKFQEECAKCYSKLDKNISLLKTKTL